MRTLLSLVLAAASLGASTGTLEAQDWAKAALEKSSRHREYVALKHGERAVQAFVVYPEVKQKAPVVLLIHEIFGLSDWAKEMADELAAQGYIVIAPDLLSGAGSRGGGTDSLGGQDNVTKAVSGLPAEQVIADLDAAAEYAKKLPAANGKLFVAGFCWGGGKSFAFATHRHDLAAAFVFYGTGPADVTSITAPVYGFYAGNDARVGATVPATIAAMKAAGKRYDPITYEGAGHGFMRAGEAPDATAANRQARDQAFERMTSVINRANAGAIARSGRDRHGAVRATVSQPGAVSSPACHEVKRDMPAGA
ncbi:MAG: dienelactone hydrolase family protein [Acidobacteriota bacterium]|nr:dienelactone hydrolase family protein [Acidobacteriota bacterium]